MRIALCIGDFRDAKGRDTRVAVGVKERLGSDFRNLESMLVGSMDVDTGDRKVRLPCGANRHTMEERLDIMK